MGETTDQIERHISETRNELGDNIHELQQKVKTAFDWRAQVQDRPGTAVAVAFGGGLLLSFLFGGRSSRRSSRQRVNSESRALDYDSSRTYSSRSSDWDSQGAPSTWAHIRDAALAVAGTKLGAILEEFLPGFQEQYRKKTQERRAPTSRPNGPESFWGKASGNVTAYES
jgi:Protein of unknown function (DUF3618)